MNPSGSPAPPAPPRKVRGLVLLRPKRTGERRRVACALALSLLAHLWLLRMTFGGEGWMPAFGLPWQERRAETPDLRVVLVAPAISPAEPRTMQAEPIVTPLPTPSQAKHAEHIAATEPAPAPPSSPTPAPTPASTPTPTPTPSPTPTPVPAQPDPVPPPVPSAPIAPETPPEATPVPKVAAMPEPLPPERLAEIPLPAPLVPALIAVDPTNKPDWIAPAAQPDRDAVADRLEAQRVEAAQVEAARVAAERAAAAEKAEAARREAARADAARAEAARIEASRIEVAKAEAAKAEAAKVEAAKLEAARIETARKEASRLEATRVEIARAEIARGEAIRAEALRAEAARAEAVRAQAAKEDEARDARRRAIGRMLDEEADRRKAAEGDGSSLPLSVGSARRFRLFGRSDPNEAIMRYAALWSRKIEMNMAIDMVREAVKQPHTDPMVTVAVRGNGSVESVTFVRSSGVPALDEAIRRVVESQAPYPVFSPALALEYDVIEIRRTWHFDVAIRLD